MTLNQQFNLNGRVDPTKISISAKIALHLPHIEKGIKDGIPLAEIVNQLREQGICDISLNTFKRTIARIRKRNRANKGQQIEVAGSSLPDSNPQSKSQGLHSDQGGNEKKLSKEDLAKQYPDLSDSQLRKLRIAARHGKDDDLPPLLKRIYEKEKQ